VTTQAKNEKLGSVIIIIIIIIIIIKIMITKKLK